MGPLPIDETGAELDRAERGHDQNEDPRSAGHRQINMLAATRCFTHKERRRFLARTSEERIRDSSDFMKIWSGSHSKSRSLSIRRSHLTLLEQSGLFG
jgi:hypothetical protein